MTPDQFLRAEQLFHRLADLPAADREAHLETEDGEVAAQVRLLLAEEDAWNDGESAGGGLDALLGNPLAARQGDRIGPYRLGRRLGEGGMGVVFEAEQVEPVRRTVALKLIKWGMDTRAVVSRFRAERQALALMDHPGVARVFEVGATDDGRPYFAMERVDGEPLTTYCDCHRLSLEDRVELMARVCDAVQHAHQRGVIHRDLKPSNVLVREVDGRPQPVVIDFGIAKATGQDAVERSLMTVQGAVVGTPDYMSPEQAATGGLDVDTRSDVFSLGVVLYELLAGVRPYPDVDPGPSGWEMHRRRLTEDTPKRPSSRLTEVTGDLREKIEGRPEGLPVLARRLRGDLDWIVLRSLERDRDRRYAAAADLAADLRRYLAREPVSAGPPDRLYRLSKFVQRHRVPVASAAVIILALILGAGFATLGLVRARSAEREAVAAREAAEREAAASAELASFMVGLFEVSDPSEARGNAVTAREILDRGVARIRSELAGQPKVQARLMSTMGNVYLQLGLYPESTELLKEAAAKRRSASGRDDSELATTLLALGKVERRQMHLDEARAAFEEAMRIREQAHGPDSPEVEEVLRSLAVVHRLLGDTDTALAQLERSLALAEAHHGPRHRETASVLNNLAVAAYQAGDLGRARQALERSLAILEPELGPDHPDVGTLLNNLGMIARRQGDNPGAIAYYERTLEASRRVLGDRHPDVAFTLRNLGFAHMAMGRYAAARTVFEESLDILAAAMGPDNVAVGDARGVLADLAVREGRLADAAESARRALELYGVPDNHQQQRKRLRLLEGSARIARLQNDPAVARSTCEQAIREASNLQDPGVEAARCQVQLAMLAWRDGDSNLAWRLYREATADLPGDQASFLDDAADTASRAAFLGLAGEADLAMQMLELGFDSGRVEDWVRDNPDLEPLRRDPRWPEVLASLEGHLGSDSQNTSESSQTVP